VILTDTEIKEYLGLDAMTDKLTAISGSVESWVKAETGRKFEETTYTTYPEIHPGQDEIILPDRPVTELSVFSAVVSRDDDGSETLEAYNAGAYFLDGDTGIISMLYGARLPLGRHRVKCVCKAGFTEAQITAAELDDIRNVKYLIKTLLSREYALSKDEKRHVSSISYGDESTTYRFALDSFQKSLVYKLQRKVF
jgi:hypothetical protein